MCWARHKHSAKSRKDTFILQRQCSKVNWVERYVVITRRHVSSRHRNEEKHKTKQKNTNNWLSQKNQCAAVSQLLLPNCVSSTKSTLMGVPNPQWNTAREPSVQHLVCILEKRKVMFKLSSDVHQNTTIAVRCYNWSLRFKKCSLILVTAIKTFASLPWFIFVTKVSTTVLIVWANHSSSGKDQLIAAVSESALPNHHIEK